MDSGELRRELGALPALVVRAVGPELHVSVPAIDDTVRLRPDAVLRARRISSPQGDPALELAVRHGEAVLPLILLDDDVVWAPADTASQLDSALPVRISDAPPLVAYSEMERNGLGAARALDGPTADLDAVGATLLLQRCIIAGALRHGLRPVRAVAWWRQLAERLGDDFTLGRFRPDPQWDALLADADRVRPLPPA
ncbi:hypothetical protein [Micromonospora mirobrigensis]|uniref:Uncharacterized protein n=1 Tax=Micromonospora mirobrigensis TaxID=262898 RepID=A0A1C4V9E9_9ACTN|nr:hypothetical protein [Micromonospora mirobrigensis]SCE80389.1 hypothetical protein GA0070564_1011042 [Micromonospora mirobrigensis]